MSSSGSLTYKAAGVDVEAADRLVSRYRTLGAKTAIPGVLGGIGGFAACFALNDSLARCADPVLVSSTDGVGTKLKLAFHMNKHDTIGQDLVAMCVNDLLTVGAQPLFFLDYLGVGKLEPTVIDSIVSGISDACRLAGCALMGGETAELPGLYQISEYDLAGFVVGVVDRSKLIDGTKVKPGDAILGVESEGLHSNGFALAQKVLFEHAGLKHTQELAPFQQSLGLELLRPTPIYARFVHALLQDVSVHVHAMANITGGGLPGNLPRVLPEGCSARLQQDAWSRPPIFSLIQTSGNIEPDEMFRTFNMGLGYVLVVPPASVDAIVAIGNEHQLRIRSVGQIIATHGEAEVLL